MEILCVYELASSCGLLIDVIGEADHDVLEKTLICFVCCFKLVLFETFYGCLKMNITLMVPIATQLSSKITRNKHPLPCKFDETGIVLMENEPQESNHKPVATLG